VTPIHVRALLWPLALAVVAVLIFDLRIGRGMVDFGVYRVAAGRALALMRGRTYVLPQDVFDVAPDIMRHRLVLSYEALAREISADHVLARVLSTVPAPRIAPSQVEQPTAMPGTNEQVAAAPA